MKPRDSMTDTFKPLAQARHPTGLRMVAAVASISAVTGHRVQERSRVTQQDQHPFLPKDLRLRREVSLGSR